MPLCFDIAGAIGTHPAFEHLLRFRVEDGLAGINSVDCEWAPQPPSQYLDDRSAFDAFIAYRHEAGPSCFVGVETKYIEPPQSDGRRRSRGSVLPPVSPNGPHRPPPPVVRVLGSFPLGLAEI
jgi:hypothetical protein